MKKLDDRKILIFSLHLQTLAVLSLFPRTVVDWNTLPPTARSLSSVNSCCNSVHRMVFTRRTPFLLDVHHDTLAAKGAHPVPVYYWRNAAQWFFNYSGL